MRAMVIPRFGGPEVFEERDIERPLPGPGEVLVRVIASGTNPVDAKLRQDASWAGLQLPLVLGYDVAGIVESVGPGATRFKPGDEVYYTPEIFGNRWGSYAEYNCAPETIVWRKPRNLTFEEAAAVPLAGGTAWEAIVRRLKVRPGETVLIHGGAGGVGSFAIQFARAAGARVLATAGTKNQEVLERLGVDLPIDYTGEDTVQVVLDETDGQGVDAVFDTVGGDLIASSVRATRPFGRLATILDPAAPPAGISIRNQTLHGIFLTREWTRLQEIAAFIEHSDSKPLIGEILPLAQVRRAHERLDSGHGTGKVVLTVAQP